MSVETLSFPPLLSASRLPFFRRRCQNQLLALFLLLSVPLIKSILTPDPFKPSRLSLQPSCKVPAKNANVEYLLRPPQILAVATQFGVQSSPRFSGIPTRFFSLNFCTNLPFRLREYHQNIFPKMPDNVRYDFFTFSGSLPRRKNWSRGGADIMTLVTFPLKSASPCTPSLATLSAIGEQPPFATMLQLSIEYPLASLFVS
mmetsp:Transcript_26138/g.56618  ORF Transcript_26138/g.56618 Transcript_26138/m.56618 type:complete len:201 (-) Transcript_26138:759-1361(-)